MFIRIEPTDLTTTLHDVFKSLSDIAWISSFDKEYIKNYFQVRADETIKYIENKIISKSTNQQIVSYCGTLNIQQSASLLKQAKAILTHDTGLMHIASCFNVPIVAVWGNTTPLFGMSAYTPTQKEQAINVEVSEISCRPCSKIGFNTCPKKHFNCMEMQNTEKIIEAISVRMQA
jgi:ADP-heptose:LPS heptosyltransferase